MEEQLTGGRKVSYPIKVGYYHDTFDDFFEDKELFPESELNGKIEVTFNDYWLPDWVVDTGIYDTKTKKVFDVLKATREGDNSVLIMKAGINPVGRYAIGR